MGLANTGICSQCTLGSTDAYLHAIWLFKPVHAFWITVTETLSTILSNIIPSSPTLCLLGDISEIHIPQKHRNPLLISLVVAKKVVLQNWKSKKSCHINNWKNLISEYISLEKIQCTQANINLWRHLVILKVYKYNKNIITSRVLPPAILPLPLCKAYLFILPFFFFLSSFSFVPATTTLHIGTHPPHSCITWPTRFYTLTVTT